MIQAAPMRGAVVGLVLVLAFYAVLVATMGHGVSGSLNAAVALAINSSIAIPVLYWSLRVERRDLASLGIGRLTLGSVGWALLGVVAVFVLMGVYYVLIAPLYSADTAIGTASKATALPAYQWLILIALATSTEELVFRFYAISRLHWLTKSKWIASLAPFIVFVAVHIPGYGWLQVIPIAIGAIVFTALYWLRRDFWCNAMCHCLIDVIGLSAVAVGWQGV